MNVQVRFPPSNEIKRMIAIVMKAGLPIGPIEIHADGVTIHPPAKALKGSAYDQWKATDQN